MLDAAIMEGPRSEVRKPASWSAVSRMCSPVQIHLEELGNNVFSCGGEWGGHTLKAVNICLWAIFVAIVRQSFWVSKLELMPRRFGCNQHKRGGNLLWK